MPLDLTDDKSTLVQVMTWCRQATSHYLSQCWPRSMSPNGVIRLQWVNPLRPCNAYRYYWTQSSLVQIMTCFLVRHWAITWTNGILSIGPLGTNFSEILIGIPTVSFKKMQFKMSSAERRPFCLKKASEMSTETNIKIMFTFTSIWQIGVQMTSGSAISILPRQQTMSGWHQSYWLNISSQPAQWN